MAKRRKAPHGCYWKGNRLYTRDPRDGRCKSLKTDVPELAAKVLAAWHVEALGGQKAPTKAPLLSQRVAEWLAAKAHKASIDDDRQRLSRALLEVGDKPLDRYTPTDINRFLGSLDVSPATRNRYRMALNGVFRLADREGVIPRNPVALTEHLPEQRRERVVSEEEFQRLRAECDEELVRFVDVLWHTGCRAGEVHRIGPDGWVQKTKNGQPRKIPLNSTAKAALESGFESAVSALGQRFRTAARRAGLEDVRPHDLRHSCAVRLRRKGVDLMVIKELLGHKSWQMVARYQHVAEEELLRAVAED